MESNAKLPPLEKDRKQREEILRSKGVASLIESKNLLSGDLNILLFQNLLTKQDKIKSACKNWEEVHKATKEGELQTLEVLDSLNDVKQFLEEHDGINIELKIRNLSVGDLNKEEKLENTISEDLQTINDAFKKYIQELTGKIEENLKNYEEENSVELEILKNKNISVCRDCGGYLYEGRFRNVNCSCGKKISQASDVEKINSKVLEDDVETFLENNIWFEHACAYLMKRSNYDTTCGGYILGSSGLPHEIDVLAENLSERKRILCECKTGSPDVSEILVFSGKMQDIGCTRGILFTLVPDDEIGKKTRSLALSNNVKIIGGVLEKEIDKLKEEI